VPISDPGDLKVTSKFYNDIDDPSPGASLSTADVSGSIIQPYGGQVGKPLTLTGPMAAQHSNPAVGTLYEGRYQYVRTKAGSTVAPVRGGLCFWDDYENIVVTPDATQGNIGNFAGVYLRANTKGRWCLIQTSGKATVNFIAAGTTKDGSVAGDLVVVDLTPTNFADVLADATNLTSPRAKAIIGIAIEAPDAGGLFLTHLFPLRQVFGGGAF